MAEVYKKMEVSETKISTIQNNEKPKAFLQRLSLNENSNKLIISEENELDIKEKLTIKEEQILEIEEKPIKLIIKEENKPEIEEKPNELIISEDKEPEINLGLSLGGIYSENSNEKPISGSSSVVEIKKMNKEEAGNSTPPLPKSFISLSRPCSVHSGAEHEQRKTAFIVVARRAFKPVVGSSSSNMGNRPANGVPQEKEKSPPIGPMPSSPSKMPAWAAASAARSPALCRALAQIRKHTALYGNRKFHGQGRLAEQKVAMRLQSLPTPKPAESRVTIAMPTPKPAESKVRILMPTPKPAESKVTIPMPTLKPAESKVTIPMLPPKPAESKVRILMPAPKPAESKVTIPIPTPKPEDSKVMVGSSSNGKAVQIEETELQNPPKRIKLVNNGDQNNGMDVMKEMPSVTAVGNGPNGRKIEGFLYKYRKGQVRIVCICHGRFLSAADFVKHAGGTDVANPMKHITVSPTFSE